MRGGHPRTRGEHHVVGEFEIVCTGKRGEIERHIKVTGHEIHIGIYDRVAKAAAVSEFRGADGKIVKGAYIFVGYLSPGNHLFGSLVRR